MRWLLVKDLQILRRSPLLVGLLIVYPAIIALLIGLALSRGPEKPKVAFLNEVAPGQSTIDLGGERVDLARYASQFFKDVSMPFYGYNKPGATVSEGVRSSFWLQGMMAGFPASYFSVAAFSETDFTGDLKKFDIPTLVLHGEFDQMVPIADSALRLALCLASGVLRLSGVWRFIPEVS